MFVPNNTQKLATRPTLFFSAYPNFFVFNLTTLFSLGGRGLLKTKMASVLTIEL